jgi:hypothetical protein
MESGALLEARWVQYGRCEISPCFEDKNELMMDKFA